MYLLQKDTFFCVFFLGFCLRHRKDNEKGKSNSLKSLAGKVPIEKLKKMKETEKLILTSACLAKAQLDKATSGQSARKVNVEENVDFHDDDEEEVTGDDDYDSIHADDTDDDDNGCDEQ